MTWNPAVLGNWGDGANWVGGGAPGAADTAQFDAAQGDCTITVDVDVAGVSGNVRGGVGSGYQAIY
ncbi:MAG: hypothetical protein H0X45_08915 [Planctomycetes bacterium]|nr:hypothetical protein [Planctomycetota bacterium]